MATGCQSANCQTAVTQNNSTNIGPFRAKLFDCFQTKDVIRRHFTGNDEQEPWFAGFVDRNKHAINETSAIVKPNSRFGFESLSNQMLAVVAGRELDQKLWTLVDASTTNQTLMQTPPQPTPICLPPDVHP